MIQAQFNFNKMLTSADLCLFLFFMSRRPMLVKVQKGQKDDRKKVKKKKEKNTKQYL